MKHSVLKRMLAAMLALSFIFSAVPEDILTFDASAAWEEPRSVTIDFETDTVGKSYSSTKNGNGAATVVVADDPYNSGGKALKITSNNWNQGAIIPISLPYELQNYDSFSFDIVWNSGTPGEGNRKVNVYAASDTGSFINNEFGNSPYSSMAVCDTGTISDLPTAYGGKWNKKQITVNNAASGVKGLKGDFYLAVGVNTNQACTYMIDNLTFTLSEDFTLPGTAGAAVSAPTLKSVTGASVIINAAASPGNGQTVEYGISTTNTAPSKWQDGTTFGGLAEETTYYIFARSKANAAYRAGPPSSSLQATTTIVLAPVPVTAGNGAAETGIYRNMFVEAGFSEEEVDARVQRTYNRIFNGADGGEYNIYVESGNDKAYIHTVDTNDVRSEGMSYGMMITLQMNDKEKFDKLWNWAYTYMRNDTGDMRGYYAWKCSTDGARQDSAPAPDGELYFATALLFASNRWGDGEGVYNYGLQARQIIYDITHRRSGEKQPLMHSELKIPIFSPMETGNNTKTDASYHLPQFFDIWAEEIESGEKYWEIWDNDETLVMEDAQFYREAATACRDWLREKGTHPVTGLSSDYATFDGAPTGASNYYTYDSWRTAMNIAVDYSWWAKDPWQIEHANKVQAFFAQPSVNPEGLFSYNNKWNIDGTPRQGDGHSTGMVAGNAAASLGASNKIAWEYIKYFWDVYQDKGTYRYYGGCLYMFAVLQLSGNYKAYYSTGPGDGTQSRISMTKAYFDKAKPADIDVTVTLNGNTLSNIKNGGSTLSSGSNYTVSGSTVSIKKDYLGTFPDGTNKLTFNFSNGQSIDLSVSVEDTNIQILGRKFDEKVSVVHTVVTNVLETSFPAGQNILKVKKTTSNSTAGVAIPIRLGANNLASYATDKNLYITMTSRSNISNQKLMTSVYNSKAEVGALGANALCADITNFTLASGQTTTLELPITIANASSFSGDIYVAFGLSNAASYEFDVSYVGLVPESELQKEEGSAISAAPAVSGTPTTTSITVGAVSLAIETGQNIQYAISTQNNAQASALSWQSGTVFNGLTPETTYYVYARSAQNSDYYAGEMKVSAAIATAGLQNGAAVSGVPTVSGTPTASSITVSAVSLQGSTGQSVQYAISTSAGAAAASLSWQSAAMFDNLTAGTNYYVYARSAANDIYRAGTPAVSEAIKTADLTLGSALSGQPTANGDPTHNTININALTLTTATGQIIQYAISASDNAELSTLTWQTGLSFTELSPLTTYYIYARSAQNATYAAGAVQKSAGITTADVPPPAAVMLKYDFSEDVTDLIEYNTNRHANSKGVWKAEGMSGESGVVEFTVGQEGDMIILPFKLGSATLGDVEYIKLKVGSSHNNTTYKEFGITTSTTGVFASTSYGNVSSPYVRFANQSGNALVGNGTWNSTANQKYTVTPGAAADMTGEIKLGFSITGNGTGVGGTFQIGEVELVLKAGVDPGPTQQAGAPVDPPTVFGTPSASSITVSTLSAQGSTGQSVQYAISTSGSATPESLTWQSSTTFNNLTAGTDYYVYARSVETALYKAGTPSVSEAIKTFALAAGSALSGKPTANGEPTPSSITVNALQLADPRTGQEIQYAISKVSGAEPSSLTWQRGLTFNGLDPATEYYVYARSEQNEVNAAGAVQISDAIKTTGTPPPATMLKYEFSTAEEMSSLEFNTGTDGHSLTWQANVSGEPGVIEYKPGDNKHGNMLIIPFNLGNLTVDDIDKIKIRMTAGNGTAQGKELGIIVSTTGQFTTSSHTSNAAYVKIAPIKVNGNQSWPATQELAVTPGAAKDMGGEIKIGIGANSGQHDGGAIYRISEIEIVMKEGAAPSPELSPESADIDIATAIAPITVNMTLNGNTLTAIKNGSTTLTQGTDYTVSGAQVQISANYLSTLAKGKVTLSFEFNTGKTKSFVINVKNSNGPSCLLISPDAFKKASSFSGTLTTNNGKYPVTLKYNSGNNYGNVYAYFDIAFEDDSLSDYKYVTVTYQGIAGDVNGKSLALFAGTTSAIGGYMGSFQGNPNSSNAYLIAPYKSISGNTKTPLMFEIGASGSNTSQVSTVSGLSTARFVFYPHMGDSSGATSYSLADVVFHNTTCDGYCDTASSADCEHESDNAQASDCTQPNICTKCGETLKAAIAHTLVWGKNDTNHWQKCSVCQTYTVSETEHNYGGYTEVTPQTCQSKGEITKTCQTTGCGHIETSDYGAYSAHVYDSNYTVDTPATCTTAGSESKKCTTQGCSSVSETKAIDVLGHNLVADSVTAATCTTVETTYYKCDRAGCSHTESAQTAIALGHNYNTYTNDGTKHWQECTRDGCNVETAKVNCAGDGTWVTTDGTDHWKVCATCNGQYSKAAHTSNNANATDCMAASTCTICEKVLVTAGSHNFTGAETINQEATCAVAGNKTVKCANSNCQATTSVEIPATGNHSYAWKKDDTKHWQECSVCQNKISETAHTYSGYSHENGTHWQVCTHASCDHETTPVNCTGGTTWLTDGNNHWKTCTACTNIVDLAAHTSDNAKASNCTQDSVCTICARVMVAKNANHILHWTKDDENHWQACQNCTIKLDTGTHSYGAYTNNAAQHWQVCTQAGCGHETVKTDCTGGSWQTNTEYHWKKCTTCTNELNKASHRTDNGNENNCSSPSLCLDCGKELKPAGSHDYQWMNGDDEHWQECSKCDAEQSRADHEFDEYTYEGVRHWQVCTEPNCDKETEQELCTGGEWITNDTDHWKECTTCSNKLSEGKHISDGAHDGDCTQANTCTACQKVMTEAGSHNYVWDNSETQHWEKCSACGHERNRANHAYSGYSYENNKHWRECTEANCNHKTAEVSCVPGSWVTTDATNHWQKCTTCPNEMNKGAHTSNNVNAGNCTHDSVCPTCAKVMVAKNASHTFKWMNDENGHWQKCDNCPIKQNESAHSFIGYVHDTDGHWQECNSVSCDYKTAEVPCTPGDVWVTDGSNHWKVCTACSNKLNTGAHESNNAKQSDCTQNSVCTTCAKVMDVADASHYFEWKTDGSQHWQKCKGCPVEQNRANHAYSGYSHENNQHWQICTQAGCGHTTAKEACSGGTWVTTDATNHWKVCSSCTNQYEKANHTWTDGTGTGGFPNDTNHRCSCGRAVAHSYGDYVQVTAATCQSKGERTRTCQTSGCGHVETSEYPNLGAHNYAAAHTVDTPATCTAAGEESRKCQTASCNAKTGVRVIAALGHDMQVDSVDTATCTTPQVTHYECSRDDCDITSLSNTASALGHDWGEGWVLKTDQTGVPSGQVRYERYCSRTDCSYHNTPDTKDEAECPSGGAHDFSGAGVITKQATCAESGERTITCSNSDCTAAIVQSIPVTGVHTSNNAQTTNCLAQNVCTVCSIVLTPAKAGHNSNDAKSADCTQDSVCTDCGVKVETKNDAHTLSWVYNNYNHWQECANCTTILNNSAHSYSGYEKSDTQHWQVCTEANCNYTTDKTAHVSNDAQKTNCLDPNNCRDCGEEVDAAKTAHNSNLAHEADCTKASICSDCNTVLKTALAQHVSDNAQAANCLAPNTCQNCTTIIDFAKSSHESDNAQTANCLAPNTCKHCPTVMNVAKASHNSDNANASDCTQKSVCRDCNKVLAEAGSHNSDNANESDCTKASKCETCNKILAEAGSHNSDNAHDSDCTKASICKVCSKELAAAGNHTSDNAQTLNCEDPNTCIVCDTVINEGKGHTSNNAHESDCTAASVCTVCSQELVSAGSHDYVWQSDGTQHWQYCGTCKTKTAEVNCAGGSWVTSDGTNHWKVCATCGKEHAKASHISDGAHATDCTKANTCTVCTKVLLAAGNHSYEWQSDGTQHRQHCSTCQKETAKVNCSGGTWVTSDATNHWKVCATCKKDYAKAAHTSDNAHSTDCTAASKCETCSKIMAEAGSHSYEWHSNGTTHWQVCSNENCADTTTAQNCSGGTLKADDDNHWRVCTICSKDYEKMSHNSDNAHATDCTKASKCTVCTKELVAAGSHDFNALTGICTTCDYVCTHTFGAGNICTECGFNGGSSDVKIGHVVGNASIGAADGMTLQRHMAEWYEYDDEKEAWIQKSNGNTVKFNLEAADLNGDGYVNAADSMLLQRFIAEWYAYDYEANVWRQKSNGSIVQLKIAAPVQTAQ